MKLLALYADVASLEEPSDVTKITNLGRPEGSSPTISSNFLSSFSRSGFIKSSSMDSSLSGRNGRVIVTGNSMFYNAEGDGGGNHNDDDVSVDGES